MKFLVTAILAISACPVFCQNNSLSVERAIDEALKNNASIQAANLELESQQQLQQTSFDLPKTDVLLLYGQYNSYPNDNSITVSQSIPFSAFGSQGSLNRSLTKSSEIKKAVTENEIVHQVKRTYYQLVFMLARHQLLQRQDSIYEGFLKSAALRHETGETTLLEKTTAEVQRNEIKNLLKQNDGEIAQFQSQLKVLTNSSSLPDVTTRDLKVLPMQNVLDTISANDNPSLRYMQQQIDVAHHEKKLLAAKFAPDLLVGFFSQTLIGGPANDAGAFATSRDRFTGFQFGISLPLWFVPHQARVKSMEFNKQVAQRNYDFRQTAFQQQVSQTIRQLNLQKSSLDYYLTSALPNSTLILKQAETAYREGEIGYAEYLFGIRSAINIQEGYLKTINEYNQTVIQLEFLAGYK